MSASTRELGGPDGTYGTAITNIEQGRQQVTLRQVWLASALGCQPGDLYLIWR